MSDGRCVLELQLDKCKTLRSDNYTRAYYMNGGSKIVSGSSEENTIRIHDSATGELVHAGDMYVNERKRRRIRRGPGRERGTERGTDRGRGRRRGRDDGGATNVAYRCVSLRVMRIVKCVGCDAHAAVRGETPPLMSRILTLPPPCLIVTGTPADSTPRCMSRVSAATHTVTSPSPFWSTTAMRGIPSRSSRWTCSSL